ncbi:MAG: amidohydrolase family protein [Lautropia sp.]
MNTDFAALRSPSHAIAPEIVLTPQGPARDRVVVVESGTIASVDTIQSFRQRQPGAPVLELAQTAMMPGMLDAHTHAGQTFGKALICGEPTQIWRRIWVPLEDALTERRAYLSAKLMFLEALRGGFTTVVDFNRNSPENNEAVHRAAVDSGIRLVSGVAASTDSPSAAHVIGSAQDHAAACRRHRRVHPSLCFGFYGESLAGLELAALSEIGKFCVADRLLFQMHSNEHFPDVHDCIVRFGKRPIELWNELGILHELTLLHHATLVSPNEIALLAATGAGVSYNPVASQWKGNAVAPALEYAQRGVTMGLGTDATRMDGFRNMDAAENCQRIAHGMPVLDFSCGAGWTWVEAATRGGAQASGLGAITGAIEPGLAADYLLLDMRVPELLPSYDFEWELVRFYQRDQIRAVVVGGDLVMVAGRPVGWDMDAFMEETREAARQMVEQARVTRVHGVSSSLRPGR